MNCRPHGSRPTIVFWMLVAIADTALLVPVVGLVGLLLILAGVVLLAAVVVAVLKRKPKPKVTDRARNAALRVRLSEHEGLRRGPAGA